MTRALAILLSFMPFAFAAQATEQVETKTELTPWYYGMGIGNNDFEYNYKGTQNIDDSRLVGEVFAGYLINDYTAIEVGYRDLGAAEFKYQTADKVSIDGLSASLISRLPYNNFVFSLEAGVMNYWLDSTASGSDSDIMIYSGAGVQYNLSEQWAVGAKYRRYAGMESEKSTNFSLDSNYVGLALTYRFGNTVTVVKPVLDTDNDGVNDNIDQCADTPANYQVDATGCTLMVQTLKTVNIDIKFANNSSEISAASTAQLEELVSFLRANPEADLAIHGHTSTVGQAEHNQKLSVARAEAVAAMLVTDYQINADKVTTAGHGESQPLVAGDSKEAHEANRRIEAVITMQVAEPALRN